MTNSTLQFDDSVQTDQENKQCIGCRTRKPIQDFWQSRTGKDRKMRYHARCKKCESRQKNEWRKANYCPKERAAVMIRNTYGIGKEEYLALIESQGGRCAICRREIQPWTRETNVDHCHKTGNIRGILCRGCNHGLGGFQDSIAAMEAAIEYLSRDPLPFVHKSNRPKKKRGGWADGREAKRGKRRKKNLTPPSEAIFS